MKTLHENNAHVPQEFQKNKKAQEVHNTKFILLNGYIVQESQYISFHLRNKNLFMNPSKRKQPLMNHK